MIQLPLGVFNAAVVPGAADVSVAVPQNDPLSFPVAAPQWSVVVFTAPAGSGGGPVVVTWDDVEDKPAFGNSATRNVGTAAGTVAAGDDSRFSDSRTPLAHNHAGEAIASGTVAAARLGSGTPSATTWLAGNSTWQPVAVYRVGTDALSAQVPDSTTAGGNARGARSFDSQQSRTNANQVASGQEAAILAGANNRVAGNWSASIAGRGHSITGSHSASVAGETVDISADHSASLGGRFVQVNSAESYTLGGFLTGTRGIKGLGAFGGCGKGVGYGDNHGNLIVLAAIASGSTQATLSSDFGAASASNQCTMRNNSAALLLVMTHALLTNGTRASWTHLVHVYRGANAASTVVDYAHQIHQSNPIGATLTIDANTTLGCLRIRYTGSADETAYVQSTIIGGFQFF